MKTINLVFLLTFTIALCSCQSNYRGRMVRVKKQKIEVNTFVKKDNVIQNSKTNLKPAIEGFKGWDELIPVANMTVLRKTRNRTESKEARKTKKIRNRYPLISKVILNQPQDSIRKDSIQELNEREFFIRDQYRMANNSTWISLGLLLTSFITVIGIFFAISQSIKAIRIYRQYKNPGVPEYYGLAWFVLIFSSLLILLIIGFLIILITELMIYL